MMCATLHILCIVVEYNTLTLVLNGYNLLGFYKHFFFTKVLWKVFKKLKCEVYWLWVPLNWSLEHLRLYREPLLFELLLHGVGCKDAVDGPLGEIPYGFTTEPKCGRCQLILLRQVCTEDSLIISL